MDNAQADMLAAREHLRQHGWIARRSEAFHHLPPPPAAQWLGPDSGAGCAAPPLAGAGWTLLPLDGMSAGGVDARWLDAQDAHQRAQLLAGLPGPGAGEAASFAWAHRALCRRGLRVRVAARPGHTDDVVCLALRHQPHAPVEAPLLVLELDPGVRVLLLETHERAADGCRHAITQNLHAHVHLGSGARLEHLRIALPGAADQVAHHVHARLAGGAHYAQALVAGAAAYHLQRSTVELEGAGASAHNAALLLAADGAQLDHQVASRLQARHTRSQVESLALAQGAARVVSNAHTRIAPGADEASVRQRLSGVPLGGPATPDPAPAPGNPARQRAGRARRHLGRAAPGRAVLRQPARAERGARPRPGHRGHDARTAGARPAGLAAAGAVAGQRRAGGSHAAPAGAGAGRCAMRAKKLIAQGDCRTRAGGAFRFQTGAHPLAPSPACGSGLG